MPFRDQKLVCQRCGRTFFFTVTEQRQLAAQVGEDAVVPPEMCPGCRNEQTRTPSERSKPARPGRQRAKPQATTPQHKPAEASRPALGELEAFPLEVEGVKIKLIGRVKWYSREKGYGFLTTANNQEIFFHRASLQDRNVRLHEGDQVEFQIEQTPKGPEAVNVGLLPED